MKPRNSNSLLPIAVLLILLATSAAPPTPGSTSFTTSLEPIQFACNLSTEIEQPYSNALRLDLHVDFESSMEGNTREDVATTILGGVVAVALPRGVEMAGDARMYFLNEQSGEYDFMYSMELPQNSLTDGLEQAMANATGANPWQIMSGLEQMQQQLAPAIPFKGPADDRLLGNNPDYAVAGKTWLMPVNIGFEKLVNVFDPVDTLQRQSSIRVKFPLSLTGEAVPQGLMVYAGGISTSAVAGTVNPDNLPDVFIPLADMPAAPEPVADDEGAGEPQEIEPPQPVPALIYANRWFASEFELDIPDLSINAMMQKFDGKFLMPDTSKSGSSPGVEEQDVTAGVNPDDSGNAEVEDSPLFIGIDEGGVTAPPAETTEPPTQDIADPVSDDAEIEVALPEPPGDSPSVEVALGTLPEQDIEYHIELKPITGSAMTMPAAPQAATGTQQGTAGGGPSYLDEMALVEEGYFLIGTSNTESAGDHDELPQSSEFLPSFYIDKYPVTNRKFYQFVIETGYKPEGKWDKYYSKGAADLPVRGVTWNDASAYATSVGKRLPTEAEWEKAARGSDGRLYPWGNDWSSEILPRGEMIYDIMHAPRSASPYGVMGMVGVLWQWTSSQYAPYPYNPEARSDEYVLRGGCFSNGRNIVRCANRYSQPPNVALNTFSFRCAMDVE